MVLRELLLLRRVHMDAVAARRPVRLPIKGYQGFSTLHYIVSIIVVVAALTAGSAMLM